MPGFAVVEFEGGGLRERRARAPSRRGRMLELQKIKVPGIWTPGGLTEEIPEPDGERESGRRGRSPRAFDVKPWGGERGGPGTIARPAAPLPELQFGDPRRRTPRSGTARTARLPPCSGRSAEEFAAFVKERRGER